MLNYVTVRIMRAIKKEIIRVYIRLLEKCNDLTPMLSERILVQFVFPLGPLLKDFH